MSEWKKVKIGEIFKIEKGSLQSSKCIPGKYDFITAATDWKTHESYSHDCEAIVYAVAASGSLGRAHYVKGKFIASDLCFILTEKNKEKYPINFLFYQLVFEVLRDEIVSKTKTGTSKESINQKNFSNYEIPYIPYDYQMNNYKKLVDTKKTVIKILKEIESQKAYAKQLRQNILQEAIEGKLTEEWRKENPVVKGNPDFDAEALFEKIQEEKCLTDSELPLETSLRIRNSKKKVFEPIAENEQPFEIPEGWKWVRFGETIEIATNNVDSMKHRDKIQISPDDIEKGTGRLIYPLKTVLEKEIISVNHLFEKNVLIYSKVRPRLRKIVFVDFVGLCSADMYPLKSSLNYGYIKFLMLSDYFDSEVYKFDNRVKMPKINQPQLNSIKIPLPPLAEQKEIVSRVEKLLANVTELEKQITEREEMTKQLMQSIMKDAFREG